MANGFGLIVNRPALSRALRSGYIGGTTPCFPTRGLKSAVRLPLGPNEHRRPRDVGLLGGAERDYRGIDRVNV
jgi:hypothetical protein